MVTFTATSANNLTLRVAAFTNALASFCMHPKVKDCEIFHQETRDIYIYFYMWYSWLCSCDSEVHVQLQNFMHIIAVSVLHFYIGHMLNIAVTVFRF